MNAPLRQSPTATAPLDPKLLEEIEHYLTRFLRPQSAAQLAAKLENAASVLKGSRQPPRDLFLYTAAVSLLGLAECDRLMADLEEAKVS